MMMKNLVSEFSNGELSAEAATLIAWLEQTLRAFTCRLAVHDAALQGDALQLSTLLDDRNDTLSHIDEELPITVHITGWPPSGESALHLAARSGNADAVASLLERGASVEASTSDGWTPLHSAAFAEGDAAAVALLLARRANPRARTTRARTTPLHVAAFNGRLSASKLLVAAGADADALDADGCTAVEKARYWLRACPCTNVEPSRQWGAVIALLEKLVVAWEDPEERTKAARRSWELEASSALQQAILQDAAAAAAVGQKETSALLAGRGDGGEVASDERRRGVGSGAGGSCAALAARLACFGEFVDARDHDGTTALHTAAVTGSVEGVALLLGHGASANTRSHYADTPLHFAAREGHLAVAQLLVGRGRADVHATTKFGATALDHAARGHSRECQSIVAFLRTCMSQRAAAG